MNSSPNYLPHNRLETRLPDAKPLLTRAEARAEAERCLGCTDAPCTIACPTEIDIPTFIQKIATDNVAGSARTILTQNLLGYSCARVCPVEVLCVGACVYNGWHKPPIQIGKLQRYATEHTLDTPVLPRRAAKSPRRVATIGAGPASLACAGYLALEGHKVVLFERAALPGGLNTTGVAPYKMHSHDALREVEFVRSLGVEIRTGVEVGRDVTVDALLGEYDAVFLGVGLGPDGALGVPGEDGDGVIGAVAWIERMKNVAGEGVAKLRRVLVVGGGNTAIDVAREMRGLGVPEVAMVYRRTAAQMSGYKHEMAAARVEGVQLIESRQPTAVVRGADGRVTGLAVKSTVDGREEVIPCSHVVVAIGQSKLRALAEAMPGVALDAQGRVVVDAATRRTGNAKVYAGGDCINGGKEVVNAVADGREAARAMMRAWS